MAVELKPDYPWRTRAVISDLNKLRETHKKWAEQNPGESKLSIVCIHILFPVEQSKRVNTIKMKFKSLTAFQAQICNGNMYLCDGCALLFDNVKVNPVLTGNYQLVKWKDFYKNINKLTER